MGSVSIAWPMMFSDASCNHHQFSFMNIYVGNLPYNSEEASLEELFSEYGQVDSVKIIVDRESGRSRGFGFVEMENDEEANEAIEAINGIDFEGRTLVVNKARPRKERN